MVEISKSQCKVAPRVRPNVDATARVFFLSSGSSAISSREELEEDDLFFPFLFLSCLSFFLEDLAIARPPTVRM